MSTRAETIPVLIVGGGGAGLTSSILLSKLGIETLLVSRYPETSRLPKAHILNQRTMEIFTDAGVAPTIIDQSTPNENMRGVAWYSGLAGDGGRRHGQQCGAARRCGKLTGDNMPFDVLMGASAVEVKTILEGKNPKITMHPESLARKVAYAKQHKLKPHTVVIDARGPRRKYYYKQGIGSFRLSGMKAVSRQELSELIR